MPAIPQMGAVQEFWGIAEAAIINGADPTATWQKLVDDVTRHPVSTPSRFPDRNVPGGCSHRPGHDSTTTRTSMTDTLTTASDETAPPSHGSAAPRAWPMPPAADCAG